MGRVWESLQGINGAAAFAQPWQSVARCHTKSWGAGRAVVAQDYGVFVPVSTPELQTCFGLDAVPAQRVCAFVPDSTLTRCHWLDSGESCLHDAGCAAGGAVTF